MKKVTCKVALLQLVPGGDIGDNIAIGEQACREAGSLGADIAVFPEMWSNGYQAGPGHRPIEQWRNEAIDLTSPYIEHFRRLARELNMAIAVTYLESWPGAPRNTACVLDRHGEVVITYAKVHTCDFGDEAALTPGDQFLVGTLDTRSGPVMLGAMICFDREFPESARILMLKGAELIIVPNAYTMTSVRKAEIQVRAFENMVGVAMANYAAPYMNGQSIAFHPMAFGDNGQERDTLVLAAGDQPGVFVAEFDMAEIRQWRDSETQGNAYRKPHAYQALIADAVQAPFVRGDAVRPD